MIAILYEVMSQFWEPNRSRSRSSQALDDDMGAAGDDDGLAAGEHELKDGYDDDEADLAEKLGAVIEAQPVVPERDSQIPPDSLDQPASQPAHHGEPEPVYLVPEIPEPEPSAADLPQPTSSPNGESQITPTELEVTPERTPSNASGVHVVEVLESPPVKDTVNTETMKPKDLDLESVQAQIAKLKQLD